MEFKMGDFQLDRKVVLITGAVYGTGLEITESLAEAGVTIVFDSLPPESIRQGLENYRVIGIEACDYVYNVTDEEQVQAMVIQIKGEVGSVDILVNSMGIIKRIPMVEVSAEKFRQVIDVDLDAPFIMAKAVIPDMTEKGHGEIINIYSMISELGRGTVSAYAAAKGGLRTLTKNIVSECGQYNIQCSGIGPDYIETPQTAPLREPGHPFSEFILGRTPVNRRGASADLADPAAFLASNASDFANGYILYVDGGILVYIGEQP